MSRGGRFGYHPISNLASRRSGASEARILLPDVRSGKLERVGKILDQQWAASGATYKHSLKTLARQSGKKSNYKRIRFLRWLFNADGMSVEIGPEEWGLLNKRRQQGKHAVKLQELTASTMSRQFAQSCPNSVQPLLRDSTSMT